MSIRLLRNTGLLTAFMALVQLPMCSSQQLLDLDGFKKSKEAALLCAKQEKWKRIAWRPTMQQALTDASKEQKPIMVALVVGKKGEKNASEC